MVGIVLNNRWPMVLPQHRADRYEWTHPPYWEPERLDSMCANIKPGDVVFDIGAEEGEFGALAQMWVGPEGGVVLVEPNPFVWPNIRAIWNANDLPKPIGWWAGFASNETVDVPPALRSEDRTFLTDLDGWPHCAHGPIIGNHGFRNVSERAHDTPQITIDDLADRVGRVPNAITMDIEGAELVAMRGAAETLADARPLVWISVHHEFMAEMYGHSRSDLIDFMAVYDYVAEHIAYDHEEHVLFYPAERADEVVRP